MKKLIYLCCAAIFVASCNPDTVDLSGGAGTANTRTANTGTLETVPDSLARLGLAIAPIEYETLATSTSLGVTVTVPVIPDDYIEPTGLVPQFTELARLTGGETDYVRYAQEITQTFVDILDSHLVDNADVVFMIDGTASMQDDIDNVKRGVTTLIKHIHLKENVKVGVAVYRDISDGIPYWYECMQLTDDYDMVEAYVNSILAFGGGPDWPESVYDAAIATMDTMEWRRNSAKMMLVLGDAPALTGERTEYSLTDVVMKSKDYGVDMNFYPVIVSTEIGGPMFSATVTPVKPIVSKIFPNPSTGPVTVELNKREDCDWQVTDMAGGVLQKGSDYTNKILLDLSSLPNGVYMIMVTSGSATESKMIVVAH
jgi:hypothetical protein